MWIKSHIFLLGAVAALIPRLKNTVKKHIYYLQTGWFRVALFCFPRHFSAHLHSFSRCSQDVLLHGGWGPLCIQHGLRFFFSVLQFELFVDSKTLRPELHGDGAICCKTLLFFFPPLLSLKVLLYDSGGETRVVVMCSWINLGLILPGGADRKHLNTALGRCNNNFLSCFFLCDNKVRTDTSAVITALALLQEAEQQHSREGISIPPFDSLFSICGNEFGRIWLNQP